MTALRNDAKKAAVSSQRDAGDTIKSLRSDIMKLAKQRDKVVDQLKMEQALVQERDVLLEQVSVSCVMMPA